MSDRGGTGFLDTVFDRTARQFAHACGATSPPRRAALSSGAPQPDLVGRRHRPAAHAAPRLSRRQAAARCRRGRGRRRWAGPISPSTPPGASASCASSPTSSTSTAAAVHATWERLRRAQTDDGAHAIERALRRALEPPRIKLLTQFNALPEGRQVPRGHARRADGAGAQRRRARRARARSQGAARELVRHRLPRGQAHHLGIARRRCSKSSWPTKPCTRSAAGPISRTGSRPTAAASPISIRACRTSRSSSSRWR